MKANHQNQIENLRKEFKLEKQKLYDQIEFEQEKSNIEKKKSMSVIQKLENELQTIPKTDNDELVLNL